MGTSLSVQSTSLLFSLLLGLCSGIVYDGLRALRLQRRRSRTWEALLDGAFCLSLALLYFPFAFRIGGGELRLYMLFFSFAGFALYFLLLSLLLQVFWQFWADTFFAFAHLLCLPFHYAKFFYGKLTKLFKRLFLFLRCRFIMIIYRRIGKGGDSVAARKEKKHSILIPLVLLLMLALVGAQLLRMQGKIATAQAEKTALENQVSSQQQENDALSSALEKADDREYLEELARDQLGYVTPGEKDFYDVSN